MFGAKAIHLYVYIDETDRRIILKFSNLFVLVHLLSQKKKFVQSPYFIVNLYKLKNVFLCLVNDPKVGEN